MVFLNSEILSYVTRENDISEVALGLPEFVFTYAENQAEDYPTTQGVYKFAELINEKTNGRFYNSVRPIEKLEDMKGLKIRVPELQLASQFIWDKLLPEG